MKNFNPKIGSYSPLIKLLHQTDQLILLRKQIAKMARETYGADRSLAQSLTCLAVRSRWSSLTKDLGSVPLLRCLPKQVVTKPIDTELSDIAEQFGKESVNHSAMEAAYEIGMLYASLLSPSEKSTTGVFYTPPAIAKQLIVVANDSDLDWSDVRILEPSCGGGVILTGVAERIINAMAGHPPAEVLKHLGQNLKGFEIDPFGAWLAQVACDVVTLPLCKGCESTTPVVVHCADTLTICENEAFDLVVGNPPYGRTSLSVQQRHRFARSISGHANLYALFWDQSLNLVRVGGTIVFITPTSVLSGRYSRNLRSLLSTETVPKRIQFIKSRHDIFECVRQDLMISSMMRVDPRPPLAVEEIVHVPGRGMQIHDLGRHAPPEKPGSPWVLPRSQEQISALKMLDSFEYRLSDWGYSVSTGPLIWNRQKTRLRTRQTGRCVPLIWSEAIRRNGVFEWRATRKQGRRWFEIQDDEDQLLCTETCLLIQRATSKEQSRRLIAALLPGSFLRQHGSVVIENHLNIIRPTLKRPKVPLQTLMEYMNSETADNVFRCIAGSTSVSAFELHAMPLPPPQHIGRHI